MNSVYRKLIEGNGTLCVKDCEWLRQFNFTDQEILYMMNLTSSMRFSHTKSTPDSNNPCYCNGTIRNIATEYRNVHGYVSLFVCIFGTLANSFNIAVLTRKQMKTAPFAYILTWLAITDMLLMAEYIPFALYMYMDSHSEIERFSYGGAIFILIHTHLSQVLHTMSICLTLTLAFWRHNTTRYPEKCSTLWTKKKCASAVKIAMLLPIGICIPSYFMFGIQSTILYENGEYHELYHLDLSDLAKAHNELLYVFNVWLYAVVLKLIPCIILAIISVALIKALHGTTQRREKLQNFTNNLNTKKNAKLRRIRRRADRSSHMLIAILFLFLLTEFPQSILGLLSGILGRCFFKNCYHVFGEIMDILALINGAINFILYCAMSKQFRQTFAEIFHYIYFFKKKDSNEYHI